MRIDVAMALQEVTTPVMYLRPTEDAHIPQHCVETVRRLRPDAAIHTIAGPRLILQTKPAESWERIVHSTRTLSLR